MGSKVRLNVAILVLLVAVVVVALPLTGASALPIPDNLGAKAASATATLPAVGVATGVRRPLGVYAHLDITQFVQQHKKDSRSAKTDDISQQLNRIFQALLANPAVSGLTLDVHWDLFNPNPPTSSATPYDWTYLDSGFAQVAAWDSKNPSQPPKTIQMLVMAGFDSPKWVLDQIPSCDGLFHSPPAPIAKDCGKVTFTGFVEPADGNVLPLPWNATYKSAFKTFLMALAARYGSNPAFVSVDVAGPTGASAEMFVPNDLNSDNPQTDLGTSIAPNDMWRKLLAMQYPDQPIYQNSDQAFVDEWDNAIDLFGQVFSGVTLVVNPAGSGANGGVFPEFSTTYPPPPASDKLYTAGECPYPNMSCAAITTILTYFMDPAHGGNNGKATQTSGLRAVDPKANLGIHGVKLLSALTASLPPSSQVLAGQQYDHPFSTDTLFEGCVTAKSCTGAMSPEQAEYNVLHELFDGTPAAATFGGTAGNAPLNYLQDNHEDIEYATANVNTPVQVVQADGTSKMMTAQNILDLASQKLLQIAETNH